MITAIILTKNAEQSIKKCLESVKWCDELIIIDDKSSDKTIDIVKKYKTTVYSRYLSNDFATQRNFGISQAKNEWILFVDSDEIVSDALAYEISNAIQMKDQNLRSYNGFYLRRIDFIWGKELRHGETGSIKLLRLARKNAGQWEGMAHEKWKINGLVGTLINPIKHFPHKTVDEFLKEINFYTDIKALELYDKKTKVFFWDIFLYPFGKFLINFVFKRGFMDGMPGLVFAILMSFHSFLVRGKLWLKKSG